MASSMCGGVGGGCALVMLQRVVLDVVLVVALVVALVASS